MAHVYPKSGVFFCAAMSMVLSTAVSAHSRQPELINGVPVAGGKYPEIVVLSIDLGDGAQGNCTATIVGPRTIVTAAHCGDDGSVGTFKFGAKTYAARLHLSPLYPAQDHDLSVGVTSADIDGAKPMTIGGKATVGEDVTIFGYGCTQVGGTGGNDGVLRVGGSRIDSLTSFDMVTTMQNGAALCFGDSGGPAFVKDAGKLVLLGINSKGNIQDTSYHDRLDLPESVDLLKSVAAQYGTTVCGINANCN